MRSKEFAHDYRYFPEPDLLPVVITEEWKEEVRRSLPELPETRHQRFLAQYQVTDYDAAQLTSAKALADYYEAVAASCGEPKLAANWVLSELLYLLNEANRVITQSPVSAQNLAELIRAIGRGSISGKMGKDILAEMFATGKPASEIIAEQGLEQIQDLDQLAAVARQIIAANSKQTEQYRKGKTATLGWFVGQVMKATRGQANPQLVQDVLKRELARE
jgi:aspartyl-tRNA(Asn)/glutamyl-tRNA(Gln) amidotransferase subunit B